MSLCLPALGLSECSDLLFGLVMLSCNNDDIGMLHWFCANDVATALRMTGCVRVSTDAVNSAGKGSALIPWRAVPALLRGLHCCGFLRTG